MFRSSEQSNFSSIVAAHIANPDAPLLLEGAAGLGKTRAYLAALMEEARAGKRIAIALPSHHLIDQLLASSDLSATKGVVVVEAFRPARFFEDRAAYAIQRNAAMSAPVMICTSASVIIDHRLRAEYNGVFDRDYILFDEADQLPNAAALQSDTEITASDLREAGMQLTNAEETARAVLAKQHVKPEVRAAARMIIECVEEPAWFWKAGVTDDGGVALWHRMPGRLLKKVANRPNVAFISATLTVADRFDDFKRSMGISQESHLSTVIEPSRHGTLDFIVQEAVVGTEEWLDAIATAIATAEVPVLVVTPSHDLAQQLGEGIKDAVVRQKDETTTEAAERMGKSRVLIAAGAWAGLDTQILWRTVIVPRVPFEKPTVLDGEIESRYIDCRNTAIRRLRQVAGRGLRSADAVCTLIILDQRVGALGQFVPHRFRQAWAGTREGGRSEVVLSAVERSPAVRKQALKHYGCRCQACLFEPRSSTQIEVHHLDPITNGERLTSIEDVIPLCANCHRLAHSESPPMLLDELVALVRD